MHKKIWWRTQRVLELFRKDPEVRSRDHGLIHFENSADQVQIRWEGIQLSKGKNGTWRISNWMRYKRSKGRNRVWHHSVSKREWIYWNRNPLWKVLETLHGHRHRRRHFSIHTIDLWRDWSCPMGFYWKSVWPVLRELKIQTGSTLCLPYQEVGRCEIG